MRQVLARLEAMEAQSTAGKQAPSSSSGGSGSGDNKGAGAKRGGPGSAGTSQPTSARSRSAPAKGASRRPVASKAPGKSSGSGSGSGSGGDDDGEGGYDDGDGDGDDEEKGGKPTRTRKPVTGNAGLRKFREQRKKEMDEKGETGGGMPDVSLVMKAPGKVRRVCTWKYAYGCRPDPRPSL